ncbi:pheST operon leader peptide PheM [Salmonella enterica]|nr:pheST operon leader peptide PheM [Salmonella enterica subsp. enterica serovar Anatum]EKJ5319134.1 pheST operon leader peptide PheM [Salmonella enterica]
MNAAIFRLFFYFST